MTTEEELALSYYREIGQLNADHGVALVRHNQNGRIYVRKTLTIFNEEVYRCLMHHPVPNTPCILEVAEDGGVLIVIEEYIDGTNLEEIIEKDTVPFEQALDITEQLCRIVLDLHSFSPPIIHRDIKPSNIILTDGGTVKLLDMNAAKQYRGSEEQDTQLIGTAGFAAPEQYGFGASAVQTDIYAIGVLMATMTRGTFSRGALGDSPFDRIVEKCTRMDPKDRYCTVGELLSALDNIRQSPVRSRKSRRFVHWLPPGFRSLKLPRMIMAFILYGILFSLGATLTIKDPISQFDIILNRVFFILCSLSAVFFLGNYMNVWEELGITKIKQKWLRQILIVLGAVACFLFLLVIMILIEKRLR